MRGRGCNVKAAKQGNWSVAGQVQDGTEVEAKSGILGPILRRGFGPLVVELRCWPSRVGIISSRGSIRWNFWLPSFGQILSLLCGKVVG